MKKITVNLGEIGYISEKDFIREYIKENKPVNIKIIYKWTWLGIKKQSTYSY